MNLIGLPGRNPETELWLQTLTGSLELGQLSDSVAHYRHWDTGGEPDVVFEASRIAFEEDDVAVAKSMGTLVLLTRAQSNPRPSRAVFIGTPIVGYPPSSIDALQTFADTIPSLFIQQTSDFAGSFEAVREILSETRFASLAEVAGEDHVYADTAELKVIIEVWWQSRGSV
jgi:hypothetical protein